MQAYALANRGLAAADGVVADGETAEAAGQTLLWLNGRLADLAPGPVDRLVAVDLTRKRDWAFHALIGHGGEAWARRRQLELTGGRPLAICTGGGSLIPVKTELGWLHTSTDGCFKVWTEPSNRAGKRWSRLCPDCRGAAGHRNPYRDARRALRTRVKTFLAGRT
jgi:hypothetical protein